MRSSRCGPHTMRLFASCSSAWCAARRTLDHRLLAPSPIVPLSLGPPSSLGPVPLALCCRSRATTARSTMPQALLRSIYCRSLCHRSLYRQLLRRLSVGPHNSLSLAPAAALTATLSLALLPPALPYRAAPGFSWYIIIILVYTVFTFTVWLYPKLRVPQTFGRQYHYGS